MRTDGFTLLEVLVALAVLSLAMLVLVQSAGQAAANSDALRERTLAHWVALDRLTEVRVIEGWPEIGRSSGRVEQGQQQWYWQLEVSATTDIDLRRLDIAVYLERRDGEPVVRRVGFVARPLSADAS